jgi:hypothetical protein
MDDDGGDGEFTAQVTATIETLYELAPGTVLGTAQRKTRAALRRKGGTHATTFVYRMRP